MRVIAVIPAFNESRFIRRVVEKTLKYVDEVVVADDASQDDTASIAFKAGAHVITHKSLQRGAGINLTRGINKALVDGADIIVTLDGDGQHNPDEIPDLVWPIADGKADFVVGSRFTDYKSIPLYRRLGISTITYLYNIGQSVKVSDGQSGFRAYRKEIFEKVEITEAGFGFSVETLVKIRKCGFRFYEVPIVAIYHGSYKLNSSMNPIKHGLKVAFKTIYWRFKVEVIH